MSYFNRYRIDCDACKKHETVGDEAVVRNQLPHGWYKAWLADAHGPSAQVIHLCDRCSMDWGLSDGERKSRMLALIRAGIPRTAESRTALPELIAEVRRLNAAMETIISTVPLTKDSAVRVRTTSP